MSDEKPTPTRAESERRNAAPPAEAEAARNPFAGVDFADLELSLYRPRTAFSIS